MIKMKYLTRKIIPILIFIVSTQQLFGQNLQGITIDKKSKNPIEYVNIGIKYKNIGTVSDNNGKFSIELNAQYDNDTLIFSCIGYYSFSIKVSDFKKNKYTEILLEEKTIELMEVIVNPKKFISKTLGVTAKSKSIATGFAENKLGYECGILIKVKKSAIIERLNLNIASCSYDTVFYRINFYKVTEDDNFENILQQPIYFKISKDKIGDKIEIDLKTYNIHVYGDFLVTIEHVKDLGKGHLYFCAGLSKKTYYRKTSQGKWETVLIGIGLNVDAQVEK